jgi:TatD DNase family protein
MLQKYFHEKFGSLDFLFDSHCHLTWFPDDQLQEIIDDSISAGVEKIIDIAVDLDSSKKTLENSQKFPGVVFPTAGIDPEIVIPGSELFIKDLTLDRIEELLEELQRFVSENHKDLIMIGECGLDYYWIYKSDLSDLEIQTSVDFQKIIFARQIQLAEEYRLPLSIHHRESLDDCLTLMKGKNVNAIFHSFTGDTNDLQKILSSGYAVGINGIATYRSAENIREALRKVLSDTDLSPRSVYEKSVFLETDAPFLIPRGTKSKNNIPANIVLIWESLRGSIG